MTPRALALALAPLLALVRPAAADSHKLLVLQSEGRADAATRAKLDAAIVRLASASEPQTAAGELTFSDAATAVGCKPETALCKDEVLSMLSVDEIVITHVAPKPGGLEIKVSRFAKGGATRDASMVLPTGAPPDKLDGIAPLFGAEPAPPPPPVAEPPAPAAQPRPQPASPEDHQTRRRLEIAGIAGGGALALLGVVFWTAASGIQSDIDDAPTRTAQDLRDLKDLESRGDAYATAGNVLFATGVVVSGFSTYLFFHDRAAARTTTARLAPAVFPHGAGIVLSFGGVP